MLYHGNWFHLTGRVTSKYTKVTLTCISWSSDYALTRNQSQTQEGKITPKVKKKPLSFLYVKCHLVLFFITTKYHQNIQRVFYLHSYSKGSLTYSVDTMLMSNITKGDNAKRMVELSFLYATCRLVLLYISTQYHQNIPKGL